MRLARKYFVNTLRSKCRRQFKPFEVIHVPGNVLLVGLRSDGCRTARFLSHIAFAKDCLNRKVWRLLLKWSGRYRSGVSPVLGHLFASVVLFPVTNVVLAFVVGAEGCRRSSAIIFLRIAVNPCHVIRLGLPQAGDCGGSTAIYRPQDAPRNTAN